MNNVLIPTPDAIPVAWGWFQFLLLLTFPVHLLAMNAMVGGLGIGISQHILGGRERKKLAHRIAVALPLVIAFVVNFGVAPLLFLQVLYGQFAYTSSILMGAFWIMVIPLLIIGYYGAYLYDFRFSSLGKGGILIASVVFLILLVIGYFFSNNMLLMTLPETFSSYFDHMNGTVLVSGNRQFLPRYLHMVFGALAVGGLFVALLGRFKRTEDEVLAAHASSVGMKVFSWFTCINAAVGIWYLLMIDRPTMLLFMGGNLVATICFAVSLLLTIHVIIAGFRKKLWSALGGVVVLVYLMSFLRAWIRSDYLREFFTLGQLEVIPEYSPMIFFFVVLLLGLWCIGWMLKLTTSALQDPADS
ncbi:MAG: hypothetical protein CR981_02795 [Proteobacteria bacterium]|nr:MAG: hypothetical protein CR981_02795 [Pseudomonadota bacterium]